LNKYALFGFMSAIMLYVIYLVATIEGIDSSSVNVPESGFEVSRSGAKAWLNIIWGLLSFSLDNVPGVVSMIFWPFTLVYGYMAIDIIKDLLPF